MEISPSIGLEHSKKIPLCIGSALFLAAVGAMLLFNDNMIHMAMPGEILIASSEIVGALAVFYHFKSVDENKRGNAKWVFLALLVALIGLNGGLYSQFVLKAHLFQTLSFAGGFVLGSIMTVLAASKANADRNIQRHKDLVAETEEIFQSDSKEAIRVRLDKLKKSKALDYAKKSTNPTFVEAVYEKYPEEGANLLDAAISKKNDNVAIALALKGAKPSEAVQSEGFVAEIVAITCKSYHSFLAGLIISDAALGQRAIDHIKQHYSTDSRDDIFKTLFKISEYKFKEKTYKTAQIYEVFAMPLTPLQLDLFITILREVKPTDVEYDKLIKSAIFQHPQSPKQLLNFVRTLKNKNEILAKLFNSQDLDYISKALDHEFNDVIIILLEEAKNAGHFQFVDKVLKTKDKKGKTFENYGENHPGLNLYESVQLSSVIFYQKIEKLRSDLRKGGINV